jgi:hypothetical protein
MSLTRAEAARALGMKDTEVVDVTDIDGGTVVTTHDGVQTLVADDGTVHAYAEPPEEQPEEEVADEPQEQAADVEPARPPRKAAGRKGTS